MKYETYKKLSKDQKEEYNWKFKEPVILTLVPRFNMMCIILVLQIVSFTLYFWAEKEGFMNESLYFISFIPLFAQIFYWYVIIAGIGFAGVFTKYAWDYHKFLKKCKLKS